MLAQMVVARLSGSVRGFWMSAPATSTRSFASLLRRFARDRDGASALEFAIVAPFFFGLMFAILETALMFFASQTLETMTQNSMRMILTGQAQKAGWQATDFKTYVCGQIPAMFSCSNISIDVQSYTTFAAITFNNQINPDGTFNSTNLNYNPGNPGDIVVVRVFYPWQLFVTGLGYNIANMANSQRLLIATATFVNEPYN
jgi:Flp pilus assembly protein TadG